MSMDNGFLPSAMLMRHYSIPLRAVAPCYVSDTGNVFPQLFGFLDCNLCFAPPAFDVEVSRFLGIILCQLDCQTALEGCVPHAVSTTRTGEPHHLSFADCVLLVFTGGSICHGHSPSICYCLSVYTEAALPRAPFWRALSSSLVHHPGHPHQVMRIGFLGQGMFHQRGGEDAVHPEAAAEHIDCVVSSLPLFMARRIVEEIPLQWVLLGR